MIASGYGPILATLLVLGASEPRAALRLVGLRDAGLEATASPSTASTQRLAPADEQAQAAEAFDAGEAAYAEGRYVEAIEHFDRAHDLVPHPSTAYNLGLAQAKAGRVVAAYETFETLTTSTTPGEHRRDAQVQLASVRTRVAMVAVERDPEQAVCVDGVALPPKKARVLRPGRVRVEAAGWTRDVRLEPGELRQLDLRGAPDDRPGRRKHPRAFTPLLVVAAVAGAGATSTATAAAVEDRDPVVRGLAVGSASAAAVAAVTGIAALALHMRWRKDADDDSSERPRAPTCRAPGPGDVFKTIR